MSVATNSLGWVVQQYIHENGWTAVTQSFDTKEEAEAELQAHYPSSLPHRVYEQLNHPNERRN